MNARAVVNSIQCCKIRLLVVVLLAKKGFCSYERKARVAMLYGPVGVVKYVLVYDDIPEGDKLITMFASKNPRGISVGLQYISFASGVGKFYWNQLSSSISTFCSMRSPI